LQSGDKLEVDQQMAAPLEPQAYMIAAATRSSLDEAWSRVVY